jgi:transcriptional regulator with XRE-family HTH domain
MTSGSATLGTLIRDGRTGKLFLTQTEFAALIQALSIAAGTEVTVDQSTVARWEAGQFTPSLRVRPFIAKAFNVDPAVLFQAVA